MRKVQVQRLGAIVPLHAKVVLVAHKYMGAHQDATSMKETSIRQAGQNFGVGGGNKRASRSNALLGKALQVQLACVALPMQIDHGRKLWRCWPQKYLLLLAGEIRGLVIPIRLGLDSFLRKTTRQAGNTANGAEQAGAAQGRKGGLRSGRLWGV